MKNQVLGIGHKRPRSTFAKERVIFSQPQGENHVTQTKLVDTYQKAQKLLAMPTQAAEALFQSYSTGQQLEIISSTRNARDREETVLLGGRLYGTCPK